MSSDLSFLTPDAFQSAHKRIQGFARKTPLIDVEPGSFGDHPALSLKLELMQHSGSFKARGALNNLLSRDVTKTGVAAASGGNHGAAVAFAAAKLGVKATIFVPEISTAAKREKIQSYGADLVVSGAEYAEAAQDCADFIKRTGALGVHAYDSVETILGQGTLGVEWEAVSPNLDTVFVTVGGGGLISGVAGWYRDRVKVIGVEPEGACAMSAALEKGERVDVSVKSIAADSLGARRVGALAFEVAKRHRLETIKVPDESILAAQKTLWDALRIAAEPGAAAALAPLIAGLYRPRADKRIGVLICGGNGDLGALATAG